MQFFEATTKFVLRKSSSNSKKEKPCSIYASVELSWKREPIYLSTGKKILPSLFSKSGKPIISDFEEGTKPFLEMRELAIHLDTIRRKIDDVVFEANTTKTEIDLDTFDEKIKAIIQGTTHQPNKFSKHTFKTRTLNNSSRLLGRLKRTTNR